MKTTFISDEQAIHVPAWVVDLKSFSRWAESDGFPESARICFIGRDIWFDLTPEPLFSHVLLKGELAASLTTIVKSANLGTYFGDGARFRNVKGNFEVVPDGLFISIGRLRCGEVCFRGGMVEGSPDMVLEVVSTSSVQKDTATLFDGYWKAGISEYWLVDARQAPLSFDIYRSTDKGFVATRKVKGWLRSQVFERSFRITQSADELGHPVYSLESR